MTSEPDLLSFGLPTGPTLRREFPVGLVDLIAYAEKDGRRYIVCRAMDAEEAVKVPDLEILTFEGLGIDELLGSGVSLPVATRTMVARACRQIGLTSVVVPGDFPLDLADFLRGEGFGIQADGERFADRRRVKTQHELEGIRRASAACVAAIEAIRGRLSDAAGGELEIAELRTIVRQELGERGVAPFPFFVTACGPQSAQPQYQGDGVVRGHEPLVLDVIGQDNLSGCWADMCRTVCVGEPTEQLRRYHAEVHESLRVSTASARPGVLGGDIDRAAAEYLKGCGHPIRSDLSPGEVLTEGVVHEVGHGVGQEVHERPLLDGDFDRLVAGDVIAIEPAVYYRGFGGVRIEDMVLVTDDGPEVLTAECRYDLQV